MASDPDEIDSIDREPPIAVFLSGESFFESASFLRSAHEKKELRLRFQMPIYYLYTHALELVLKAFLRAKGRTSDDLRGRQFGHKLKTLWTTCLEAGLKTHAVQEVFIEQMVDILHPFATDYEFRYVKVGFKSLPTLDDVEVALTDLMAVVRPICEATVSGPIPIKG